MPVGFRINPGEARTDLYGINKGAAQVVDLTPLRQQAEHENQRNFAKQQTEAKAQEDRVNDVNSQLSGLNKLAVLDRERPMFAEKQAALYDTVKKNIGKIRAGDNNALLEVQQQLGDIYTSAEQSKNTREQLEKYSAEMLGKGFNKYRKDSVDYLHDYVSNPKYNGDYTSFDPSQISERFDYAAHVRDKLLPYAQKTAKANEHGYASNFTLDQAKDTIEKDLASDPIALREANDAFAEAPDKLGAENAVEFMKNKYAKDLEIHATKPVPVSYLNGALDKNNVGVTSTVTDDGGHLHIMDPKTNEEVYIDHNKNGDITGGTLGTRLTSAQNQENGKVQAQNIANEKSATKLLHAAQTFRAGLSSTPSEEEMAQYANLLKEAEDYKQKPLPYQEKGIEISADRAQEIAHDKYKVSPKEILQGKTPAHVDLQHVNAKTPEVKGAEVERKTKDGKVAIFDANTKKFIRYK